MISNAIFHKREWLKKRTKPKKKLSVENNWNSKKGWGIPCNSKIICFGVIVCYRVNFYWKKISVLLLQRIMWVITKKNRLRKIQSIWRNMKGIMEQLIAGVIHKTFFAQSSWWLIACCCFHPVDLFFFHRWNVTRLFIDCAL